MEKIKTALKSLADKAKGNEKYLVLAALVAFAVFVIAQ